MNIGNLVKRKRERSGLTQEELADILCWSQSKVSRVERNEKQLTVEELFEVNRALRARKVASFVIDGGHRLSRA